MKTLLFLICLFTAQLNVSAQTESFEGSLVYSRKFYDGAETIEAFDQFVTIKMKYTVKESFCLIELLGEDKLMEGRSYSMIIDSDKEEATLLAKIANKNMAVKFDTSYFNSSKLSKIISANNRQLREIAGLTCQAGFALKESDLGTQDTMKIWYATSYEAIPYQFENNSAPGLIVSMQQDAISYWELTEIRKEKVEASRFIIPSAYLSVTEAEFQDYISTLDQFEIVDEEAQKEMRGNEMIHEKED